MPDHRTPSAPERSPLSSFDELYRRDTDPWRFETSEYERRRYHLTVASLPRPRYASCFEPACSIGALTERLALRCDRVVALDSSATALSYAAGRLEQRYPQVELRRGALPEDWPNERFELIVLSELGYYFRPAGIDHLAELTKRSLEPGGDIVAVHWRGRSEDHLESGDTVHRRFVKAFGEPFARYVEPDFRLDIWRGE